ncbi:MAG: LemA family protein [Betaproteobacteria bacterium]|nr:LemA family protein [Betaproteobacteria bacterium]
MGGEAWAAAGVAAALLAGVAWIYNRLVAERNLSLQGFADIDVQLKRRADLVPQLVEAVRGYAAHEKALLVSVAELRAAAIAAKPGADASRFENEKQLGARLKQVLLLQEAYPQLKADGNFRDLSAKLVDTEDQLQYARRFYNGAVKQYRNRLESFPDLVVAHSFGFRPLPFFETDDREAVKVQL